MVACLAIPSDLKVREQAGLSNSLTRTMAMPKKLHYPFVDESLNSVKKNSLWLRCGVRDKRLPLPPGLEGIAPKPFLCLLGLRPQSCGPEESGLRPVALVPRLNKLDAHGTETTPKGGF